MIFLSLFVSLLSLLLLFDVNNLSGGLFDDESKDSELAFKFAVQAINNQRNKQTDGLLEAGN